MRVYHRDLPAAILAVRGPRRHALARLHGVSKIAERFLSLSFSISLLSSRFFRSHSLCDTRVPSHVSLSSVCFRAPAFDRIRGNGGAIFPPIRKNEQ